MDGEMKRLRALGLGVKVRRAEPISVQEENMLWKKGLLGSHSPQVLLDTMVTYSRLYFSLRSGKEHRDLAWDQIELVEPADDVPFLLYNENTSINNAGGLAQRKVDHAQAGETSCKDNQAYQMLCQTVYTVPRPLPTTQSEEN